jgi:hypothetical protein
MKTQNNSLLLLPLVVILLNVFETRGAGCAPSGCDLGSFCGVDGVCRLTTCSNYYEFENRRFTGFDEDNPVALKGRTIAENSPLNPGLQYRCRGMDPIAEHGYTRECSAAPSPLAEYTCYEMDASTNFSPFIARVNSSFPNECPDDETGYPQYTYRNIFEYKEQRYNREDGNVIIDKAHNSTQEFDRASALQGTIYSSFNVYITESPSVSPSASPSVSSSPTLTESPSASSSGYDEENTAWRSCVTISIAASLFLLR